MSSIDINKILEDVFGDEARKAYEAVWEDVRDERSISLDVYAISPKDWFSEHVGRSGRDIVWFYDGERSSARYIDTIAKLTEEEIEAEILN